MRFLAPDATRTKPIRSLLALTAHLSRKLADDLRMRTTANPPALLTARPINSDHDLASTAIVFHALGNRNRLNILRVLLSADEPMSAGRLRGASAAPAMVGDYLRLLERAGLVQSEGRGSGTKWRAVPGSTARVTALLA